MKVRSALLCVASALLAAGVSGSAQNAANSPALELLHVQGNISMVAGAGEWRRLAAERFGIDLDGR